MSIFHCLINIDFKNFSKPFYCDKSIVYTYISIGYVKLTDIDSSILKNKTLRNEMVIIYIIHIFV